MAKGRKPKIVQQAISIPNDKMLVPKTGNDKVDSFLINMTQIDCEYLIKCLDNPVFKITCNHSWTNISVPSDNAFKHEYKQVCRFCGIDKPILE